MHPRQEAGVAGSLAGAAGSYCDELPRAAMHGSCGKDSPRTVAHTYPFGELQHRERRHQAGVELPRRDLVRLVGFRVLMACTPPARL
jgi:hypothetical protein